MTAQLAALLRLRASILTRAERTRVALALAAVAVLGGLAVIWGAFVGDRLAEDVRSDLLVLLPTAFLAFGLTAAVAAIASSGGREVLPRAQLAPFPVSPAADYVGAVLLAPFNLAWILQAVALGALVAAAVGPTAGVAAAVTTTAAWVVTATVLAQALAWAVELARTLPGGVWLVRGAGAILAVAVLLLSVTGRLLPLLDDSPTLRVVVQALQGAGGQWLPWLRGLVELTAVAVVALYAGARLARALSRRPRRDQDGVETRSYPARADLRSDLLAALRVDRAGVWRSAPLRRGLLVLALLPGGAAALAGLSWELLPMLPALVASAAALLFGVNAFGVDAGGAVWRESLPARHGTWLSARAVVLAEVVLAASLLAVGVAAARAPSPPSVAAAVAVSVAVVVAAAQVLARCLQWSLHRPHRADLRNPRDAAAPPAAMAWYSARLALSTTLVGVALTLAARTDSPTWSVLVGTPVLLLALRRLVTCGREWGEPEIRARVVSTVASG